jgi:tetratricopeptide (TPR) repeat protein
MIDPAEVDRRILPTMEELHKLWRVGADAFTETISTYAFLRNRQFTVPALFVVVTVVALQLPIMPAPVGDVASSFQTIPSHPDYATLQGRGNNWYAKGDYARAIEDYNKALVLNPMSSGTLFSRGVAKLKSGDTTGGDADIAAAMTIARKTFELPIPDSPIASSPSGRGG